MFTIPIDKATKVMSEEKTESKSAVKKPTPNVVAGTNVLAEIDGEIKGPIYCVQVSKTHAQLQGKKLYDVPLSKVKLIE